MDKKGRFIVFEGIDGSGKSTQIKLLSKALSECGIPCIATLEPTFGVAGEVLHKILSGELAADPRVIASLFVSDRLDHLLNEENGICRTINEGTTVLCDRYCFSSYAYQSVDVPTEWVIDCNRLCTEILRADCTIFIDVSPETAMQRISSNREHTEIYENTERLTRVRDAYFKMFDRFGSEEKIFIVDGNAAASEIAAKIAVYVKKNIFNM